MDSSLDDLKRVQKCISKAFAIRNAKVEEVPKEMIDHLENAALQFAFLKTPTEDEWDEKYPQWCTDIERICGKIAGILEIIFQYLCLHGSMEDNYTVETSPSFVYDCFGSLYRS